MLKSVHDKMSQKSSQIFIKNSTIFFGVPWCSFSSYFTAAFLNNKILNSYQYAYILARTNMPGWWILFISHQLGWWVKNNILDTEIGLHCTSLMQILIQILSLCYSLSYAGWNRSGSRWVGEGFGSLEMTEIVQKIYGNYTIKNIPIFGTFIL